MFSFIHCADIHLDSPLRDLERYEGAPVERLREAGRRAFENLIDLALEREVAFVLIAGDLFDGDWEDFGTGLYFSSQMAKLRREDIRVFVVHGNHDAATNITRHLIWPENVHVFKSETPESVVLDEYETAIHGVSYKHRAESRNLAKEFPARVAGNFNIGLLHTSLDGREGHESYAPCSTDDLVSKGYDYWALGHVHKREVVRQKEPWIVFPGNLQGRHIHEEGPKGCTLVHVEDGRVAGVETVELGAVRWKILDIPWENADEGDLLEQAGRCIEEEIAEVPDGLLALRLKLSGVGFANFDRSLKASWLLQQLRAVATDRGGGQVWLKDLRFLSTNPPESIEKTAGFSELMQTLVDYRPEKEEKAELYKIVEEIRNKLPVETFANDEFRRKLDPEGLDDMLDDAKQLLLSRFFTMTADHETS